MKLEGRIEARGEIDRFDATLGHAHALRLAPEPRSRGSARPRGGAHPRRPAGRDAARQARAAWRRAGWIGGLLPAPGPSPLRGDLTVEWRDLAWPLDGDALVRSAGGRLEVRGLASRYTLGAEAAFATRMFESGRVQLAASGDTLGLMISRLVARAPRESLEASGSLAWRPALHWDLGVGAHGLDPARIWPDWPGHITVAARVWGAVAGSNRDLEARVNALGGTLRGHPLAGGGGIMSHGDHLALDGVHVTWGDARLDVHGGRGAEWDVHAALVAPTLSVLDSLASGALNAKLDVAGAADAPRIRLEARGDSLGFHGETVGGARRHGRRGAQARGFNRARRRCAERAALRRPARPRRAVRERHDRASRAQRFRLHGAREPVRRGRRWPRSRALDRCARAARLPLVPRRGMEAGWPGAGDRFR
jgi:hypothetical protein